MEIRSFNQELQFADILFSRLFKNIIIEKRYNNKSQQYLVKCIRGSKSRILKNLQNPTKRGMYTYPIIVYWRNGITRDPERVSNLHNEIIKSASRQMINFNLLAPNPINIDYSLSIISNLESDIDLIIGNFIPFFNSDLFVTCKHPKFSGLTYNSQIVMSDSITEDHPYELANDSEDITTATFNFTFKTYIFGGTDRVFAHMHNVPGTGDDDDMSGTHIGYVPAITSIVLDVHDVPRTDVVEKAQSGRIQPYQFDEYFADVESGALSDPVYDRLIWKINKYGTLTNAYVVDRDNENQDEEEDNNNQEKEDNQ